MIRCKKCDGNNFVKAGFIKGEQRYRCKECGCQFVPTRQHGKDKTTKLWAVMLYVHGFSFRTIAKLFKVNVRSVYVWVKTFALENHIKPRPQAGAVVIELDEMWHFLGAKKTGLDMEGLLSQYPSTYRLGVWRERQ